MRIFGVRVKEIDQSPLGEHNALGLSGGAGGVDQIGQLIRGNIQPKALRLCIYIDIIRKEHGQTQRIKQLASALRNAVCGDNRARPDIPGYKANALIGIAGGQAQKGAARLQNADLSHIDLFGALHNNLHRASGKNTIFLKQASQCVSHMIQLPIGELFPGCHNSYPVGMLKGSLLDKTIRGAVLYVPSCIVKGGKAIQCLLRTDIRFSQLFAFHKACQAGRISVGKGFCPLGAVPPAVVFQTDAEGVILLQKLRRQRRLYRRQLHGYLLKLLTVKRHSG